MKRKKAYKELKKLEMKSFEKANLMLMSVLKKHKFDEKTSINKLQGL